VNYTIQRMDPTHHREDVIALWNDFLDKNFNNRFNWLYEKNPLGSAKTWIAIETTENKVVGCASVYLRTIFFNNQNICAGIAVDFIIRKEHRAYGPALKLQRQIIQDMQNEGIDLIVAFPNQASAGVFKRLGYRAIGEPDAWVKILRTEYYLRKLIHLNWIAQTIAAFLDPFLSVKSLKYNRRKNSYRISVKNDGSDLSDWLSSRNYLKYEIMFDRNPKLSHWRFADFQGENYRFFCAFNQKTNGVLGGIIFTIQDNIAEIGDFFTDDDRMSTQLMMALFADYAKKEGAASIRLPFLGSNKFKRQLHDSGFLARKMERTCMIYSSDSSKAEKLSDVDNWYLFDSDMDL